ncbi:MAG: AmmeMemoRadiSam system radical SAM enzyme, partial [Propionibacteriaceae bacterium]|nr:AmmeMemoRadiSam system radical SAM enzyme [Propionibacteriaceae bacterium]
MTKPAPAAPRPTAPDGPSAVGQAARYWRRLADGRVQCDLCPRRCRLRDGQHGFCYVRQNHGGQLRLATFGRSSGFCVDPVEKKPLFHFHPGAAVLSFGTAGCNLGCQFCQNWEISTARALDAGMDRADPETIAAAAAAHGCGGVAYTYNDPVIFAENAMAVAAACRERGLANIAVSAGYIEPGPRADFFAAMDAANIDLKSFRPDFYRRLTGGRLEVVLDTLRHLVHDTAVWVEITTLVIPGHNDSDAELSDLAGWVAAELGPDVPLHFSAFHPAHRLRTVPRTPPATLERARRIGLAAGLHHVYTGNIANPAG